MRRAVILLLLVWLVVGGLSSWALAERPGWIPDEFKRGGGDELESAARLDPDGVDVEVDTGCGMAPYSPLVRAESGFEIRPGSEVTLLPTGSNAIVWWVYSVIWRW